MEKIEVCVRVRPLNRQEVERSDNTAVGRQLMTQKPNAALKYWWTSPKLSSKEHRPKMGQKATCSSISVVMTV